MIILAQHQVSRWRALHPPGRSERSLAFRNRIAVRARFCTKMHDAAESPPRGGTVVNRNLRKQSQFKAIADVRECSQMCGDVRECSAPPAMPGAERSHGKREAS